MKRYVKIGKNTKNQEFADVFSYDKHGRVTVGVDNTTTTINTVTRQITTVMGSYSGYIPPYASAPAAIATYHQMWYDTVNNCYKITASIQAGSGTKQVLITDPE